MKKILCFALAILTFATVLSGCGAVKKENKKISIVCTNFSVFDWINEIIGKESDCSEEYDITLLAKNGDIHSYQPTAQDIAKIINCNLLVYVGGSSDIWTEEIAEKNNINALKLFDVLDKNLLCSTNDHGEGEHTHTEEDCDEHIWLSLKMAQNSVLAICDKLCDIDEKNSDEYKKNTVGYTMLLDNLDEQYKQAVESSADKTIVFPDRFPFAYMAEDYGIRCFSAFPGCSADTDASFGVIADLAEAVDKYDKNTVLVLENSALSVAETVIESTEQKKAKTAIMNSCQSISEAEFERGISYLKIMEENLESLKMALQ